MIIRDARANRTIAAAEWILATWVLWFAIDLIWRGGRVSSTQWRYLMSVPGGQWSWAAIFGCGAITLMAGLITHHYRISAVGLAVMGVGSLSIAAFYLCAPLLYHPSLTTLGYQPWAIVAGAELLGAVLNWKPAKWTATDTWH